MGNKLTFHVLRAGGYLGVNKPTKEDQVMNCNCERCGPNNLLLPPGVEPEPPKADLQALQAEADERDLLLPAVFNRAQKPAKAKDADSDNLLLPPGMRRR